MEFTFQFEVGEVTKNGRFSDQKFAHVSEGEAKLRSVGAAAWRYPRSLPAPATNVNMAARKQVRARFLAKDCEA